MKTSEMPSWALRFKEPGTSLRKKGASSFGLYRVRSQYAKGGHPKLVQEFLGTVDESGFHPKKQAVTADTVEYGLSHFVMAHFGRALARSCFNSPGKPNASLIALGVIAFVFGYVSPVTISSTSLSHGREEELKRTWGIVAPSRIVRLSNRVATELSLLIGDEGDRDDFANALRSMSIPRGTDPSSVEPRYPQLIEDLAARHKVKL